MKDVYCFHYVRHKVFHFYHFKWQKPSAYNSNTVFFLNKRHSAYLILKLECAALSEGWHSIQGGAYFKQEELFIINLKTLTFSLSK